MSATQKEPSKNTSPHGIPVLLGFAFLTRRANGSTKLSIRWQRIVLALIILIAITWTGTASLLYLHFKHRIRLETVTFSGMMKLPFRLDEHRVEIGDHNVKESISRIDSGDYQGAFRLLHFGVARSPANLEGRKLLAQFYEVAQKRPNTAAEHMLNGLEYGGINDVEYLKQLLQLLLRNQMDEKVQEIADTYLPPEPVLSQINRMLAIGAANANYHHGRFDKAEDYLTAYNLTESHEGLLLSSRISWDRGNQFAAITKLEQSLRRFPDAEPLLIQLSNYYRQMGNTDKARRYAILRNVKDPLSPTPRIELLYIYNQSGETERERNEIERMFDQFSENKGALLKFADFAAKTSKVDLAKRIYQVALENGFDLDLFAILVLEAYIIKEDYDGAIDFTEQLIEERASWLTKRWEVFNGLRAVASYAIKRPDLGEIYLQHFLEKTNHTPQTYINVAHHFSRIEQNTQAHRILTAAHQESPKNQRILSELISTELKLDRTENLETLLTRLLQMRRTQMELLARAYRKLGSDRLIFNQNRDVLLSRLKAILDDDNQDTFFLGAPI